MLKGQRRLFSFLLLAVAAALSNAPAIRAEAATPQRGVAPAGSQRGSSTHNGTYYALIVGIDNYSSLPKLATAVNDAQALKEVLQTRYGFQVTLLTDASRNQILSALNEYRRKLREDDSLLIYYAGHGQYDPDAKKGYWLPVDATRDDPSNWIIADEITTSVRVIPARHVLVVSDSCYAGTLTRSVGSFAITPLDPTRYIQKLQQGKSRNLMASGGNEPVADGGAPGHSIFANALLQGLSQMEQTSFSAQDLFNTFIQRYVVGGSDQVPQYVPIPNSGDVEGDFVFVAVASGSVAPNPKAVRGDKGANKDIAQAGKLLEAGSYGSALPLFQKAAAHGNTEAPVYLGDYYNTAELRYTGVQKNDSEAVNWYRKAADAGQAEGMAKLGSMYESGRGVGTDYAQAISWYRKAADAGDGSGMSKLGSMYENGHGVQTDYAEAVAWYRKAAKAGDSTGMVDLGRMYAFGRGAEEDARQAMRWFRKAADAGDATGMRYLGREYERGLGVKTDLSQAAGWYQKAAEGGDKIAMLNLADMYAAGRGVRSDPAQAASWYGKAIEAYQRGADSGDASAMRGLASLYQAGRGVKKDPVQAVNWERRAAEAGDAQAMNTLAGWYEVGDQGVGKDLMQAVKWYGKASDAGYSAAMLTLGGMYENGREGIDKDYTQALNWYLKAADAGNVGGMFALGRMYQNGVGVGKDDTQAQRWYQKAAGKATSMGPGAMMALGSLYEGGTGAEKDPQQAVNWYRKAADAGYPKAMVKLGSMYELGAGVAQDYAEAIDWYRKAAQQGYAMGMLALGVMYHNGSGVKRDEAQAVTWYRKAAVAGGALVMMDLGSRYEQGKTGSNAAGSVEQDYSQAVNWYTKAAELGYAPAMIELGSFYERGLGVKSDSAQAANWYHKAADAGEATRAATALQRLTDNSLAAAGTTQVSPGTKADDHQATNPDHQTTQLAATTGPSQPAKVEAGPSADQAGQHNAPTDRGSSAVPASPTGNVQPATPAAVVYPAVRNPVSMGRYMLTYSTAINSQSLGTISIGRDGLRFDGGNGIGSMVLPLGQIAEVKSARYKRQVVSAPNMTHSLDVRTTDGKKFHFAVENSAGKPEAANLLLEAVRAAKGAP